MKFIFYGINQIKSYEIKMIKSNFYEIQFL